MLLFVENMKSSVEVSIDAEMGNSLLFICGYCVCVCVYVCVYVCVSVDIGLPVFLCLFDCLSLHFPLKLRMKRFALTAAASSLGCPDAVEVEDGELNEMHDI